MAEENAWELSKENIQPLKGGRKMDTLLSALTRSDSSHLLQEKQEHEIKLRSDMDNINLWYAYVLWTEQNYPCNLMHVHQLIERCVKHFRDSELVRHNEQYLKLWLKLADMLNDPTEVFNYMHSQDVGTEHWLFYKAWADHSEITGVWKKADEIYQIGIKNIVTGADHLNRAYIHFQQRLVKALQSSVDKSEASNSEADRVALASLKLAKNGKTSAKRTAVKFPDQALFGVKEKFKAGSQAGVARASFSIFGDFSAEANAVIPSSKNEFKDVPLDRIIHVENIKKLERMGDVKLKVQLPSKPGTCFEIFADAESPIVETGPRPVVLSDRMPLTARKAIKQASDRFLFEETLVPDSRNQVYKYVKSLTDAGEYEVSFEELKAQQKRYSNYLSHNAPVSERQTRTVDLFGASSDKCDIEEPVPLNWDEH